MYSSFSYVWYTFLMLTHRYVFKSFFKIVQGFCTQQLTPLEVLAAIQHAELRLDHSFTKEEFLEGSVGAFMAPEDFDFEVTVRKFTNLDPAIHPVTFLNSVTSISAARTIHFCSQYKNTSFPRKLLHRPSYEGFITHF